MGKKYSYDIFNNTYHLFYQNGYKWYLLICVSPVKSIFSNIISKLSFNIITEYSSDFRICGWEIHSKFWSYEKLTSNLTLYFLSFIFLTYINAISPNQQIVWTQSYFFLGFKFFPPKFFSPSYLKNYFHYSITKSKRKYTLFLISYVVF